MVVGPGSILTAWNGAAFDSEQLIFYFMGGGHSDYGGNEVYEFDLKSGKWDRLTDPSPLDHLARTQERTETTDSYYCWVPDMRTVPGSPHTYDGIQFSRRTRTMFLVNARAANGSCFVDKEEAYANDPRVLFGPLLGNGIYEFNPSRRETRNGLAPLSWRRLPNDHAFTYPRIAELPDGAMIVGSSTIMHMFNPVQGKVGKRLWQEPNAGDGIAEYHPMGSILSLTRHQLLIEPITGFARQKLRAPSQLHGKSLAIRADGTVFSWNGKNKILTFMPRPKSTGSSDQQWVLYDWSTSGPQVGYHRVYSKWQYVKQHDVFVGLSHHGTGVWVYKHPSEFAGVTISETDAQDLIRSARPGATVRVPPGIYSNGLFVDKSMTLKLEGVKLWGVANGKAVVNVRCDGCVVVIEDLVTNGRDTGCISGNCAGIKAEGRNFQVTIRRAHIDGTVMGVLTDNHGGRLIIEDSLIENTGTVARPTTFAHGIYAGLIDEFILRRSTVRNVNGDGHLVKSRANASTIEDVRILGLRGFHSRSIDMPCGGNLKIHRSLLQHGENTDNPDIIAIGTEPQNCHGNASSMVSISDSWVIVDRDRSQDERARTYGPNFLFRWRGAVEGVDLTNNSLVNIDEWSTKTTESGDNVLPDLSSNNVVCATRRDCGLGATEWPEM